MILPTHNQFLGRKYSKQHLLPFEKSLCYRWGNANKTERKRLASNNGLIHDCLFPQTYFCLENKKRNILLVVKNRIESSFVFDALFAYRDIMGCEKYSSDSGWKCSQIIERVRINNFHSYEYHNALEDIEKIIYKIRIKMM